MPPKPKSEKELALERQRIIDAAVIIIRKDGLNQLTMRKLAKDLNMSATNIYHYFLNKDDIYLHILVRGFNLLYENLKSAMEKHSDPLDKLETYLRNYIGFAMKHQNYYQLMMSTNDPKSFDFQNTPSESLAVFEKDNAMKTYYQLNDLLLTLRSSEPADAVWTLSMCIISQLHGAINLCHTNIMHETDNDPDKVFECIISQIMAQFR